MKIEKILGFIILLIGIAVIATVSYMAFNMYLGDTAVPEIFKAPVVEVSSGNVVENLISDQLSKILPTDTIFQSFNLFAFFAFASLMVFVGAQVSFIGIKLIKDK